jgi:protein TonB
MWQFVMNSPGNVHRRAVFDGGNGPELRRVNRLLALGCFLIIAALHAALIFAFGFFAKGERSFTEPGELFLTLELSDPGPAEPAGDAAAAEAPLPAAVPLPREEAPPPEPIVEPVLEAAAESVPVPEEAAPGIASPAEPEQAIPVAASFSGAATGVVPAVTGTAPGRGNSGTERRPMTEAEYLALIMVRLEKNKVYPLSVRKRGIEGDIAAAFSIGRDGSVSDMKLTDPSGHRFLAQAAFETIRSASPFPVMEGREGAYTVQVSIRYRLED